MREKFDSAFLRQDTRIPYYFRATHIAWIISSLHSDDAALQHGRVAYAIGTADAARSACMDGCLGLQHTEITTSMRYIMQQALWAIPRPPAYNTFYRCILLLSFEINSVSHHLPGALYYLHTHNTYCIHGSRLACHFWRIWQSDLRDDCVNFRHIVLILLLLKLRQ